MHSLLIGLMTIITTFFVFAKDVEYRKNTYNFLIGNYLIVGKYYKSNITYYGKATIAINGDNLKITKYINKQRMNAVGKIERALFADTDVLRMHFMEHQQPREGTCLFQGDLDNYARISCYIYPPHSDTSDPGLEVWFINRIVD